MKAVLFDLDGTLLNSIELIIRAYEHMYRVEEMPVPPREILHRMIGFPLHDQLKILNPTRAKELEACYRTYQTENHHELVSLYDGVEGLLRELQSAGLRIGVATSKSKAGLALCKHMFPEGLIETWVTVEDVKEHKPAPDALLLAAKHVSVPPSECVYVGDSPVDMEAAQRAGMTGIAVGWGANSLDKLNASLKARTVDELKQIILNDITS